MTAEETRRRTKVERVIDEYGLDGFGDHLEAAWVGDGTERTSLRDLATEFNIEVLQAALGEAGESTISSDVESTYQTLTDDDVPRADEIRKRRELERAGVDVDEVCTDFVTHQAIHTYLTTVRNAELTQDVEDRIERKKETIQRLASRTQVVTDSTLEELVRADLLTDRQYEVFVTVRVVCDACGADYTVDELITQGGCDCHTG
ncbi:rod-determining factor RdfA [Natronobiforma cellulositropha]|uniref:rod-determining factor RdfA n=1 Tax=Natronobiforma cellulositropha TaxID=1679076 RepID=UPI0021D5D73C|nr:rod-determining factor RdfA [Natronobiforma cellulositropha]